MALSISTGNAIDGPLYIYTGNVIDLTTVEMISRYLQYKKSFETINNYVSNKSSRFQWFLVFLRTIYVFKSFSIIVFVTFLFLRKRKPIDIQNKC